jgi:subtilisin-like proprotein convertase family protein
MPIAQSVTPDFVLVQEKEEKGPSTLKNPVVSDPVIPADTWGLPPAPEPGPITAAQEEEPFIAASGFPLPQQERTAGAPEVTDPIVQWEPGWINMPSPIVNFDGVSATGVLPPDTDGQVGPNHYVQIVNSSSGAQVRVFDKSGTQLYNFGLQNLWPAGDPCRDDANGDPVVLYDQLADRWILTQFALPAPPYYECFAVSKTGVPTNVPSDWHLYSFLVHDSKMNDYPKLAVWPDGYYMSANQFFSNDDWAGAGVWVFERTAMLDGNSATFQYFDVADINSGYGGLLPSNLMGDTLPPDGAPNYFMSVDMNWSGSNDILHIFEFHTDWATPANSSFGLAKDLVVAPFDWNFDGSGGSQGNWDIPQPGTSVELDSLSDRLMMHVWYRNYDSHESLVVNHTVDVGGTPDHAGVRWYEIRGGTVNTTLADAAIYQQGTYAPDAEHRWMGSVAMDHVGNLAVGYSVSSSSVYPGIRYAGRLAGDTLDTLPQAEETMIAGGGYQSHDAARWGDYSDLSVDPTDDCTFWYTTEYIQTSSSANWRTRIASFKFPSCIQEPDFTLSASPDSQSVCAGNDAQYDIDVGQTGGFSDPVTLSANGNPAGTTASFSVNPVTPPGTSTLTIGNTGAAAAGSYTIDVDGVGGGKNHTTSVGLDLVGTAPGTPTLASPADGATDVVTAPTFTWNAVSDADTYSLDIATDAGFSNIVHTATGITDASYTSSSSLDFDTTYFWRVRAENPCGTGPYATAFRFTTEHRICSQPNLAIPDNSATGISDTITLSGSKTVADLNVSLNASHTWVGDLIFTLKHVTTGAAVTLIDQPGRTSSGYGCSGNDIDATIDDEGADGDAESMCDNAPAIHDNVVGGDPANTSLLATFDGETFDGDWTLTVSDHAGADTGTLAEWCLVPTLNCQGQTNEVAGLTLSVADDNLDLNWSDTNATSYEIYRAVDDPYFTPDASNLLDTTTGTHYQDANVLGTTNNYYYKVLGVASCSPPAGSTLRVGEFDFDIVPGS